VRTSLSKTILASVIFLSVGVFTVHAIVPKIQPRSVYGSDNRSDVYSASLSIQNLARSVPAQFSKEIFVNKGGVYTLQSVSLARRHKSNCPNVKFSEQIVGPKCTGFLVAPNVLMTAGHCLKTAEDCSEFLWAFDYKLKAAGDLSYIKIPATSVYSCKKVLAQKYEYYEGMDYALIQLDRNVSDRPVLELDFHSQYVIGSPLFVLGYPSGLPLKLSDSGIITKELPKVYYTTLDTFHGNSGSPTFDAQTLKVNGIVSMGNGDYVWNSSNTCKEVKITKDGDTYAASVSFQLKLMKDVFDQAITAATLK
jgi:V8-like Glu-specific endopeptidase